MPTIGKKYIDEAMTTVLTMNEEFLFSHLLINISIVTRYGNQRILNKYFWLIQ